MESTNIVYDIADAIMDKDIVLTDSLSKEQLQDFKCEWRIDEWLNVSKKSLKYFSGLNTIRIDTSDKTAIDVADEIHSIVIK